MECLCERTLFQLSSVVIIPRRNLSCTCINRDCAGWKSAIHATSCELLKLSSKFACEVHPNRYAFVCLSSHPSILSVRVLTTTAQVADRCHRVTLARFG